MKKSIRLTTVNLRNLLLLTLIPALLTLNACRKNLPQHELRNFQQVNLVANNDEYNAPNIDTSLKNAWGLVFTPTGIAWVNSQSGHVSAIYDKEGKTLRPAVNIPSPGDTVGGNPTGIIFNSSSDFALANGLPAKFIFVGVDGILSAWNGGNNAQLVHNNVATSSYTGLALDSVNGNRYLYAADFRGGKIDVWDKNFNHVSMQFQDPNLPAGYAPFNIQGVENWLVVAYAKVGSDGRDEAGPGQGFVSIFNPDGSFVKRFASKGSLNAPWGITNAPAGFFEDNDVSDDSGNNNSGKHKSQTPALLVGNFGDGRINAYSMDGEFLGQLRSHSHTIVIDGLWALSFSPASPTSTDYSRLYFTAGPDKEEDGLFGYLIKQ